MINEMISKVIRKSVLNAPNNSVNRADLPLSKTVERLYKSGFWNFSEDVPSSLHYAVARKKTFGFKWSCTSRSEEVWRLRFLCRKHKNGFRLRLKLRRTSRHLDCPALLALRSAMLTHPSGVEPPLRGIWFFFCWHKKSGMFSHPANSALVAIFHKWKWLRHLDSNQGPSG